MLGGECCASAIWEIRCIPKPSTLNPSPETLNPKPSGHPGSRGWRKMLLGTGIFLNVMDARWTQSYPKPLQQNVYSARLFRVEGEGKKGGSLAPASLRGVNPWLGVPKCAGCSYQAAQSEAVPQHLLHAQRRVAGRLFF